MRSSAPDKYVYSDEHYRIEFKNSNVDYPCFVDNLIIHEGFCMNFELFLNEKIEWKWRCLKPDEKKNKKSKQTKKTHSRSRATPTKKQPRRSVKQAAPNPPPSLAIASKSVPPIKKTSTTAKKPAFKKKNVKMMSEKKFKALRFKMRLNITISQKEREIYQEQRVLRNLKKFLG